MKKYRLFLLSIFVIILDQITKYLIVKKIIAFSIIPVTKFLNLTLVFNTGSAFSFLSNTGVWHVWFFTIFSAVMSVFLLIWLIRIPTNQILSAYGIALIFGGAIGNLIDRLIHGHVIDFLDFYFATYHWPVFNVADTAISLGAMLLALSLIRNQSH